MLEGFHKVVIGLLSISLPVTTHLQIQIQLWPVFNRYPFVAACFDQRTGAGTSSDAIQAMLVLLVKTNYYDHTQAVVSGLSNLTK